MRRLIFAISLAFLQSPVLAETTNVDKETLKDMFEYCSSLQLIEKVNEKELLDCINEELDYGDYNKFESLKDIKAALE